MDAPKISTKADLTLAEAKAEWHELKYAIDNPPKFGWIRGIETSLGDRLAFVQKTIAEDVCKGEN